MIYKAPKSQKELGHPRIREKKRINSTTEDRRELPFRTA